MAFAAASAQYNMNVAIIVAAPRTLGGFEFIPPCSSLVCCRWRCNRFQDWVCYGMPAGVVRVKGVLAFDEDRLTRSAVPCRALPCLALLHLAPLR